MSDRTTADEQYFADREKIAQLIDPAAFNEALAGPGGLPDRQRWARDHAESVLEAGYSRSAKVAEVSEPLDLAKLETAVGGNYHMTDGRKFWIDARVAREIVNRLVCALEAAASVRPKVLP